MQLDALDLPDGTTLDADLCIVGGGMAGLALAREFRERAVAVVVLEGGGEAQEPESQALYQGKARLHDGAGGTQDLGGFLAESRLRCLGGSGNVWGAKCALLDESDFLARAWMPGSGWPFSRAELMPFYDRACELLRIRRFDPRGAKDPDRPELVLDEQGYVTATRHLSPVRGGPGTALAEYKRAVTEAANVRVVLHANVLAVETDERATRAVAVRAATLRGNGFRVRARAFVLAAGGIENARLLLVSRGPAAPQGLGNAHDLVGRNFANHATFGPGTALGLTQDLGSLDLYTTRDPAKVWGVLALGRAAQEREKCPNLTVTLGPGDEAVPAEDAELVALAALADAGFERDQEAGGAPPQPPVPAYFMLEQRNNPESRLTLSAELDALGLQRVQLDWGFLPEDVEALRKGVRRFARALGAEGLGRVRCEWPAGSPMQAYSPSRHHLCTTRMHPDPEHGVVDTDARVHGVANLYLAGSSVFPTGGIANPTLTLVALALRLADHLAKELA
jgi:choline dehydrogenase-like flavoprotein